MESTRHRVLLGTLVMALLILPWRIAVRERERSRG
jgi:4-amino-4-deoxy-L-arabinose transferase-like glycosyltransferase